MKTIDDKEVGKMWEFWSELEVPDSVMASTEICKLIRKLVAERAALIAAKAEVPMTRINIKEAINNFGIDPADWKDDD